MAVNTSMPLANKPVYKSEHAEAVAVAEAAEKKGLKVTIRARRAKVLGVSTKVWEVNIGG